MKKLVSTLLAIAIIAALLVPCMTANVGAADWNGYTKISTAKDLLKIKENCYGKFYLTNDINMKDYGNWNPIDFRGTLDGNGYAIKNLTSTYGGLFRDLFGQDDVIIKNLGLYNVNVTRDDGNIGALANYYVVGNISIENCYVTGKVILQYKGSSWYSYGAAGFIGGKGGFNISGTAKITIKNCYNKATVTSNCYAGGLVGCGEGYDTFSYINCANNGAITGKSDSVGGIVGNTYSKATLTNCLNTGKITSDGYYTGGIAGTSNCYLTSCYSTAGSIIGTAGKDAYMKNCATGGSSAVGKLESGSLAAGKTNVPKEDFKKQSTYKGFDFSKTWAISSNVNNGYPYLRSMSKVFGVSSTGTSGNTTTDVDVTISLKKGNTLQLGTLLSVTNAAWSSSNSSVAAVDKNGKVTAKKKGTAVITAKAGSATKKIKIIVE